MKAYQIESNNDIYKIEADYLVIDNGILSFWITNLYESNNPYHECIASFKEWKNMIKIENK